MGVDKGEMVAIMLPNCPAFLYTWMGLNKIGAVEVPINIGFTDVEVKYILQHSEVSGIVIHQEYYPLLGRIRREEIPKLRNVIFWGDETPPSGTIPFSTLLREKVPNWEKWPSLKRIPRFVFILREPRIGRKGSSIHTEIGC